VGAFLRHDRIKDREEVPIQLDWWEKPEEDE
jgi:hypothetical protein